MNPISEGGHRRGEVVTIGVHHHILSEGLLQDKPFVIWSQLGEACSYDPHVFNFVSFFINRVAIW